MTIIVKINKDKIINEMGRNYDQHINSYLKTLKLDDFSVIFFSNNLKESPIITC